MATLHLMVGLPCSGKTTLAMKLESELGAIRLTPDDWHRRLFGQDAMHPDHDARHERIEAIQWDLARAILSRGGDVILDFGLWTKAEREDFRHRAARLGVRSRLHFLDVPPDELFRRLEVRNARSPQDVTLIPPAQMEEYISRFEAPTSLECECHSA